MQVIQVVVTLKRTRTGPPHLWNQLPSGAETGNLMCVERERARGGEEREKERYPRVWRQLVAFFDHHLALHLGGGDCEERVCG